MEARTRPAIRFRGDPIAFFRVVLTILDISSQTYNYVLATVEISIIT